MFTRTCPLTLSWAEMEEYENKSTVRENKKRSRDVPKTTYSNT
jgi:hypothetical protein